jgi:hypothetical protein
MKSLRDVYIASRDQRENHAKLHTRHEVTAARAGRFYLEDVEVL